MLALLFHLPHRQVAVAIGELPAKQVIEVPSGWQQQWQFLSRQHRAFGAAGGFIYRDQAGAAGDEVKRHAQFLDAFIGALVGGFARPPLGLDLGDAAIGPQLGDDIALVAVGQVHGLAPALTVDQSADGERALKVAHPAQQHQRFTGIEIGQVARSEVDVAAVDGGREIGRHGPCQPIEQALHLAFCLVAIADMGEGATARFCHAAHQIGVWGRTNADHEDPAAATVLLDFRHHLRLVRERSVGQEDDLAYALIHACVLQRSCKRG